MLSANVPTSFLLLGSKRSKPVCSSSSPPEFSSQQLKHPLIHCRQKGNSRENCRTMFSSDFNSSLSMVTGLGKSLVQRPGQMGSQTDQTCENPEVSKANRREELNGSSTQQKDSRRTPQEEQKLDWENLPTLPEEVDASSKHPLDPHRPNFSPLLPEALRPYPSFEGWFSRLWDPSSGLSVAVVMATNYATDESQVTLLFTPGPHEVGKGNGASKGDRESITSGYTYAVAVKTKDARFSEMENAEEWDENNLGLEPKGFEWEARRVGRIVVTPHVTDIDVTVEGYNFKAHLTKELLWDAHKSEKGPEGWARYVTIIPTHWYVYSLGSTCEYSFSNPEKGINNSGVGWAHFEKNWGQTFPAGHVWLQACTAENTSQLLCAGAYFKTPGGKLESPYIFSMAYRSATLQLDFRTNDVGIVFKDIHFAPLESRFSVTAVGPSHTVEVTGYAPYDTFSEPMLAPVTKLDWEPACRESYLATAEVKIYGHLAWGIGGNKKLVEQQTFESAGLEFGEDLLMQAIQDQDIEKNVSEQQEAPAY